MANDDYISKIREPLRSKLMRTSSIGSLDTSVFHVFIGFKYKPGVSASNLISSYGGAGITTYTYVPALSSYLTGSSILELAKYYDITYIEEVGTVSIMGFTSRNYIGNLAQQTPWGITKIKAPEVWATGNRGTGIKVGVIDTGIDYNHEDLSTNYKGGYNFVVNTSDPMDDQGHGSHVCGTIAAVDNGVGVVGVAPEAYIYALKALDNLGNGSYSSIVSAIEWCITNSMDVISMSFGGGAFSQTLKDVCDNAYNVGIVLVAAAGNSGGIKCSDNKVGYPAKFSSVMAVGSTDSNDVISSSSSIGPEVSVTAPGVNILSTVPKGTCTHCDPSGYKSLSGTSMACPHISGVAALVKKANPTYTSSQIRACIEGATIDLGASGKDQCYGYGRIDALKAISCLSTPIPPTSPTPGPSQCTSPSNTLIIV